MNNEDEVLNNRYEEHVDKLIEPLAIGHVIRILRKQQGKSRNKFIEDYLIDLDINDEKSLYRWEKEGVLPNKRIIERIKTLPNFENAYKQVSDVIRKKCFEIQIGDESLDTIDQLFFNEELDREKNLFYKNSVDFLRTSKEDYSTLLRIDKYIEYLENFSSHELDLYPLISFLLTKQGEKNNNEFLDEKFIKELDSQMTLLRNEILEKYIRK